MSPCERTTRRGCFGFLCLCSILGIVGGAVLLCLGAANMAQRESNRRERIDAYKNAVDSFPNYFLKGSFGAGTTASFTQTPGAVFNSSEQTSIVSPLGSTPWEVDPKDTQYLAATVFPWYPEVPLTIRLSSGDSLTKAVAFTKAMTAEIKCSDMACTDGCGGSGRRKCTAMTLTAACKQLYNPSATYIGQDDCHDEAVCGSCYYTSYLTSVCVVVAPTPSNVGLYNFDRSMGSCYFPFSDDSNLYAARPRNITTNPQGQLVSSAHVTVEIRSVADPYIALQRATDGTMTFGQVADQYKSPAILLGIGLSLVIIFACALCCYRCCCHQAREFEPEEAQQAERDMHVMPIPMAAYDRAPTQPLQTVARSEPVEGVIYGPGAPQQQGYPTPLPPPAQRAEGAFIQPQPPLQDETYPGVPQKHRA